MNDDHINHLKRIDPESIEQHLRSLVSWRETDTHGYRVAVDNMSLSSHTDYEGTTHNALVITARIWDVAKPTPEPEEKTEPELPAAPEAHPEPTIGLQSPDELL